MTPDGKGCTGVMRKYRILLRYVGCQRWWFAAISSLTIGASLLAVAQPWPMAIVVDQVLRKYPRPAGMVKIFEWLRIDPGPSALLLIATLGGLLLFVLNSALEMALTSAWTLAGRRMVYQLAEDLFARLQRRSLLYHSRNSVGDVMSRITGDCWCVNQMVDALLFAPAHALLASALMVQIMAKMDGSLTLFALAAAPLMVGASFLIGKPLQTATKIKRELESRIQSHIQQTLTGIPVVQAFVQEDRQGARFMQFADAAIRAQQRSTLLGSLNSLGSGLITTLGTAIVLCIGARHVLDGRLKLGVLLVFVYYLNSLQAQIKILAHVQTAFRTIHASVNRVMDELLAEPELPERPDATVLASAQGHVRLDDVAFGYEPGRPVLRKICLEAKLGQMIAIVGETGAGKSTLVSLVPRFFDPWNGRVLVDGKDVRDLQLHTLRQQIAVVLQEPFLFPLSVADNIAYGRLQATREQIVAAARTANAQAFVERLPQGYDTVIGERGATLSGGERQRLSIARALLKNAPILILDEPTSALDAETERELLDALERLMAGRTTFIIAHRLSTVRRADCIVVLKDGQISERGSHDELLRKGGLYARLHSIQFGLREAAVGP
jgi:ATP-binding cassette subfamily B protein/subfamily B ATP-binding cassette protein MsbA